MSAPALHPPARMRRVLRERLERQRHAHFFAALALAGVAVYLRVDSTQVTWSAAVVCVVLGGLFLANLHEDQPAWDAALPVDRGRYALVRLACGVAGAAFLLAVAAGLYAALFGEAGQPGWYPLALFAWGLTANLLTWAVLLRPAAPGGFFVYPVLGLLPIALVAACIEEPAEIGRMGVTAVLARTALLLGLAGATASVAARFPTRPAQLARPAPGLPLAPRPEPAHALPDRPAAPAERPARQRIRRAGLARPSATRTVFRRHMALQLRVAVLPVATLLFVTLLVLMHLVAGPSEAGRALTVRFFVENAGLREACVWLAVTWAVLVWLAERGTRTRWNDALPISTARRRVLHAAAGAAWLLVFVTVVVAAPLGAAAAAGTLDSPSDIPAWLWLGLPVWTLTLYLAATFVLFVLSMAWDVFFLVALVLVSPGIGLVARLARAGVGDAYPPGGGYAAATLLLVLFAAAAAGAIALSDWIRRMERLPTVREVRGLFHEWAGTRPGTPLRGHAGR